MVFKAFKNFYVYHRQVLLGVDFGRLNTGLALFVPGRDPCPLGYARIAGGEAGAGELLKIASREGVEHMVFGLPLLADGAEGEMARVVKVFAQGVGEKSQIPLWFQDEYLSSRLAQERVAALARYGLPGSGRDVEAAKVILEDFIRAGGVA